MFGEVKNPFGLRNGKHITVNDLREDERGLACNCVCPRRDRGTAVQSVEA